MKSLTHIILVALLIFGGSPLARAENASSYITFGHIGSGNLEQTVLHNSHPTRTIVVNFRMTSAGFGQGKSGEKSIIVPPKGSSVVGFSTGGPEMTPIKYFFYN